MQVHDGLRAGVGAGGEFMEALHPSYARMQSGPIMGKEFRRVDKPVGASTIVAVRSGTWMYRLRT